MTAGHLYRCLGLLALAILIAAAQGCGGGSGSTTSPAGAPATQPDLPGAVSEAEIKQYEVGTPQHTALEWWRTVQLNEPELARTLYAEPPTLPNLAGQFNFVIGQLAGSVKIASVKPKGKQSIVAIDWDRPEAPPRQVTLRMERTHGEWKIASTLFLDLLVQELQRSASGAAAAPAPSG
jgi:hypothetical protein